MRMRGKPLLDKRCPISKLMLAVSQTMVTSNINTWALIHIYNIAIYTHKLTLYTSFNYTQTCTSIQTLYQKKFSKNRWLLRLGLSKRKNCQ